MMRTVGISYSVIEGAADQRYFVNNVAVGTWGR